MNLWPVILNAFLKYVEQHPEVVEQLIEQAITAALAALRQRNVAALAKGTP